MSVSNVFMVTVPNIAPDIPPLKKNPVFLYTQDRFQKPYPFQPDISIDISDVYEQKVYGIAAHESQFFEWLPWLSGKLESVPEDEKDRLEWLRLARKRTISPTVRESLIRWYGEKKGNSVTVAEAFEIWE